MPKEQRNPFVTLFNVSLYVLPILSALFGQSEARRSTKSLCPVPKDGQYSDPKSPCVTRDFLEGQILESGYTNDGGTSLYYHLPDSDPNTPDFRDALSLQGDCFSFAGHRLLGVHKAPDLKYSFADNCKIFMQSVLAGPDGKGRVGLRLKVSNEPCKRGEREIAIYITNEAGELQEKHFIAKEGDVWRHKNSMTPLMDVPSQESVDLIKQVMQGVADWEIVNSPDIKIKPATEPPQEIFSTFFSNVEKGVLVKTPTYHHCDEYLFCLNVKAAHKAMIESVTEKTGVDLVKHAKHVRRQEVASVGRGAEL